MIDRLIDWLIDHHRPWAKTIITVYKLHGSVCCHLWMRSLDHKEIGGITYRSIWNERVKTGSTSIADNRKTKDDGKGRSKKKNFALFWPHHEAQLSTEKDAIQGNLPGNRKRWRPKTTCLNITAKWTEMTVTLALRTVDNRTELRRNDPWCGESSD